MLFFQLLLLGGYLYVHVISVLLKARSQVVTHLVLLAGSLALLPITLSESWKPTANQSPPAHILALLAATVGYPYFVLSATGPLIQHWFSQTHVSQSPYRLYALSNTGSLLALLSYPLLVEPWLTASQQAWWWSIVYCGYAMLMTWCGSRIWRHQSTLDEAGNSTGGVRAEPDIAEGRPSFGTILLWLSLAACSSGMFLATTNQLCIDIASVPLLWILPFSVYLTSFILCFDSAQWYDRRAFGILLVLSSPAACWVVSEGATVNIFAQAAIYLTMLFACCMTCHGELANLKPPAKYLTTFYFILSVGGVLGGFFVAVVAPNVFRGYWEYHIGLVACCVATLMAWCAGRVWRRATLPAFWIWTLVEFVQVAFVGLFCSLRLWNAEDAPNVVILFGACALICFAGLILTGKLERWPAKLVNVWCGLSVVQCLSMCGFGFYLFPEVMDWQTSLFVALLAILALVIAIGLLKLLSLPNEPTQRLCVRVLICFTAMCGALLLLRLGSIESWQVVLLSSTVAAAVLLELCSQRVRAAGSPSPGFWFWGPCASLIVILACELGIIIEKDGNPSGLTTVMHVSRNFYGVLRVTRQPASQDGNAPPKVALTHGQIQHGFQFDNDKWRREPTAYYGRRSGVGLAIACRRRQVKVAGQPPLRVGVVGLGAGTVAAFGETDEYFRFYEINRDVLTICKQYFTYLADSAATSEVIIGDARIVLERELANGHGQQFDVLVVDAFSSDAIPIHLLTSECGEIYSRHLRPGGILAIHVSNRFLDLNPVLLGMADHLGWNAIRIENKKDNRLGVFDSNWILLSSQSDLADQPELRGALVPWSTHQRILHWTDDYSGLWQALSFR